MFFVKCVVRDVPGMDFLGFGMPQAFIYQASCRPRLFMLGRFFPSIKYNYIFAFFIFLLINKFGQKSANFGQFKSWPITIVWVIKNPWFYANIARNWQISQFKPKKDQPGILALGYYFFSFLDISKNSWTNTLKNLGKMSSLGKLSPWA